MNNSHTLHIEATLSRITAINLIKQTLEENPGVVLIDLTEARFPLYRDFFLVIGRRFASDRYIMRVKDEKTAAIAKNLGIQVEVAGVQAEFERSYEGIHIATHNMTMWEYFLYEIRRGGMYLKFLFSRYRKKEKSLPHFKKRNSNNILIIAGLIISLTLLLFIFHFAVSKTLVTITPQVTVRPISANLLYKSDTTSGSILNTRNTLSLKKMVLPVKVRMKFRIDTIDPNSAMNARGVVQVYNELTVKQELRPTTRFVTNDGLVFRTVGWLRLPAARTLNGVTEMGVSEVEVMADPNDASGNIVGKRGNVPTGTNFTIPGLKFNRDKVYAKAKQDFIGGDDPRVHLVTREELDRFEKVVAQQLTKVGREQLQANLQTERAQTGEDYALLVGDALSFSGMSFNLISGQKIGESADEVEIEGIGTITATVFDRKASIEALTKLFQENLLRGTDRALKVHTDTLRVTNVVSRNADDSEMKLTAEMDTSVTYDFENTTNELTRRLKTIIAGLSQKEAIDRLINEGHVKEVEIKAYPFWVGNVTSNIDNIEFVIKK